MRVVLPVLFDFIVPVAHQISLRELFPVSRLPGSNSFSMKMFVIDGMSQVAGTFKHTFDQVSLGRDEDADLPTLGAGRSLVSFEVPIPVRGCECLPLPPALGG